MSLFRRPAGIVWLALFIHSAIVFGAALLPWPQVPLHLATGFINSGTGMAPEGVQRFLRWDAHWYTYIAQYGYDNRTIVFFPMLILLIRSVAAMGIDYGTSGWLVSNFFAVLSMFTMHALFRLDLDRRQAGQALLAYSLFPTSMFLNSVYTEPLFITFAAGCVYCVRTKRWAASGLLGAMAALTRNIGVFLFVFMAWEYWRQFMLQRRGAVKLWVVLPVPLALVSFMVFNYLLAGDVVAFANAQRGWGRQFGWPWDNFVNGIQLIETGAAADLPGAYLDIWIVGISLMIMLVQTLVPGLRLRLSYLLMGWLWLLLPMFSTAPWLPLYSMARFALVVFPLYFLIGRLPRPVFLAYCLVNAVILAGCTVLFTRWYWIG